MELNEVVSYKTAALKAVEEADKVVSDWEDLASSRRQEGGEYFHAVNVKRHFGEDMDLAEDPEDFNEDLYELFLEEAWDELNYLVSDYGWLISENGMRIFQYGRMGGWACFQTIFDDLPENIDEAITDVNCIMQEGDNDGRLTEADVIELESLTAQLKDGIDKIETLKQFIHHYNHKLSLVKWWINWRKTNEAQ